VEDRERVPYLEGREGGREKEQFCFVVLCGLVGPSKREANRIEIRSWSC
jgi:hypothetical protein